MVKFYNALAALAVSLLAGSVVAHPGEDPAEEWAQREAYLATQERRDVGHCNAAEREDGRHERAIERRSKMIKALRREYNLDGSPLLSERDVKGVLGQNHSSSHPYNPSTPETTIFGSNSTCLLTPEIWEGPYYVEGEYYRQNVTIKETGVKNTLELQIVDKATCKPISGAFVEIWSCNSTGVYSGIVSSDNGNGNDLANINNTALRGIQQTDENGVATFNALVPGHYAGRANHIHILVHTNATLLPNKTISGGSLSHIGQTYFDQALLDQVEATLPYSRNTIAKTPNANDMWLTQGAASGNDPVWNYVLLGKTVSDGIFSWMSVGVDQTAHRTISHASSLTENGGVKNPNSGGLGGFPFPFPMPSGLPGGFPWGQPPTVSRT